MHQTQSNLIEIQNKIKKKINESSLDKYDPKIIAVSKTFSEQEILPLLNFGHNEFGENKVQEAVQKWKNLKGKYDQVRLHMLGKLQTNKVKNAVEIFDYIHSLDNLKLANKLAKEIHEKNKDIKISFIFCSSFSLISFKLCAEPISLNLFLSEKNFKLNFLLEEEI